MEEESAKTYIIPENFIDESRIINGMFVTRNFVEGVILALLSLIPAMALPLGGMENRLMIITMLCLPGFLIGVVGCNGDPISVTLQHGQSWLRNKGVMLFNNQSKMLSKAPLDAMMEKETPNDKIQDILDTIKENREKKKQQMKLIEGETFEFAEDKELVHLYHQEDPIEEEPENDEVATLPDEPLLTIDTAEPVLLIPHQEEPKSHERKLLEVEPDPEDDMTIILPEEEDKDEKKGGHLF